MTTGNERGDGVLVSWNESRGFGFIAPSTGGRDVFVHISDFVGRVRRPRVGERLTFELDTNSEGKPRGRLVAAPGIRITDGLRRGRMTARQISIGYLAIAAFAALYLLVALLWGLPLWVHVLYLGSSVASFVVYAADKSAAAAGRWRTSESTLLAFGLIGGWPGAIVAQRTLRHKSRKHSFQVAFWGTVALNVIAFIAFSSLAASPLLR